MLLVSGHGLHGLRVVDASAMPTIMIAEKACDMILEDANAA